MIEKNFHSEQIKTPILVTGLPGVIGFNAFHYFKRQFGNAVIGIVPDSNYESNGNGIYRINADDNKNLKKLFEKYQFATVIDASGCCKLKSCEYNIVMSRTINLEYGCELARLSNQFISRYLRFSSDLVFDGVGNGNYTETDPVSPVTVYGKHMAEAETLIAQIKPDACILRIPLPMGPSMNGHAGAIDWIESRFKKRRAATLYFDEVRSNIYVQDIIRVLEYVVPRDFSGLFHLGGPIPLSLNQIAQIINRVGGYEPEHVMGCYRHEAGPVPPRAGNVSMDSAKILQILPEDLIKPWPIDPRFIPDSREWHLVQPHGCPEKIIKYLNGYDLGSSYHPVNYLPDDHPFAKLAAA